MTTSRGVSVSPGRASSRAAPPPLAVTSWPSLTRCTVLSLSCAGRLPVCSDPRIRPFQIVQTRATHSVRLSLSPTPGSRQECLGPNLAYSSGDDGADGHQRPGCHDTGPGPYLAHSGRSPMGLACTCCVLYRVLCTVMSRGPALPSVSSLHHQDRTLAAPSRIPLTLSDHDPSLLRSSDAGCLVCAPHSAIPTTTSESFHQN